MTEKPSNSIREAEQDVERARARLQASIRELENRISPHALMERAVTYLRTDGRRYTSGLTRQIETNHAAVALIGLGLSWLIGGPHRKPADKSGERAAACRPVLPGALPGGEPEGVANGRRRYGEVDAGRLRQPVITGGDHGPSESPPSPAMPPRTDM